MRKAIVPDVGVDPSEDLRRVQNYLPSNYQARTVHSGILIFGSDNAGWTLDDYVIPRLASGLIFAEEIK